MEGAQYRPWWNVPSKWVSVRELVKSSFKKIIIKKKTRYLQTHFTTHGSLIAFYNKKKLFT